MNWKTGLLMCIIFLSYQTQASTEIHQEEYAVESQQQEEEAAGSGSEDIETFLTVSRASTLRTLFDMTKHRTKRSSVFPTGVKVCPRESEKQILASHLAYYRLRVCQEAVWEAYRIFYDRIPYTAEYQYWVDECQKESFCLFDIGKHFSESREHLEIIQQRVKERNFEERKEVMQTEETASDNGNNAPSATTVSTVNEPLLNEIVNETKPPVKELVVTNTVPEQPMEQMVEFSVTLTNQKFTAELGDATSGPYKELASNFQQQMQKVFEKLPGFKEIQVLRFRQKKEDDGSSSIAVSYAVIFQRGNEGVQKDTGDDPVIASNKVENGNIKPENLEEEGAPAVKYTVTELYEMVAMALQDDKYLPVDLKTLHFVQDLSEPPSETENDILPVETITAPSNELDDALNAERPLDNPSPETEESTEGPSSEHATSYSNPDHDSSHPEGSRNDISSNAIEEAGEVAYIESTESQGDIHAALPTESMSETIADSMESSGDAVYFEISTDGLSLTIYSQPSLLPPQPNTILSVDEILTVESSFDSSESAEVTVSVLTPDNISLSLAESEAMVSPMVTPETVTMLEDSRREDVSSSAASYHSHSVIEQSLFPDFPSPSPASTLSPGLDKPAMPPFAVGVQDIATELDNIDSMSAATTEEVDYGSAYISMSDTHSVETTAAPSLKYLTTSSMTTTAKGKELVVFFSLRVTNLPFSDDLFNRSSLEYKALEQQLMQLLLPYLKSNLTGFKQLEILNFRNGSVIVNSKMKFAKYVPYNITEAVHCVLEDFCDAAARRLNLEIDSYSLDVEPADQADPCKFMACDAFSECIMNSWTKEVDCHCKPGYVSIDGLPCRSLCELEPNLCVNEGKCEIVSEKGAVCRCPVSRNWLYRGERCAKFTPDTISVIICIVLAISCLLLLCLVIPVAIKLHCERKSRPRVE